jgi:hypothetical protein
MARSTTKLKQSAEYVRGYDFGVKAARENIAAHGRLLATFNVRDLEISARKRDADAFDKGYAVGYRSIVGRA